MVNLKKILFKSLAILFMIAMLYFVAIAGFNVDAYEGSSTDINYDIIYDNNDDFVGVNLKDSFDGAFRMKVNKQVNITASSFGIVAFEFGSQINTSSSNGLLIKFVGPTIGNMGFRMYMQDVNENMYRTFTGSTRNDVFILEDGTESTMAVTSSAHRLTNKMSGTLFLPWNKVITLAAGSAMPQGTIMTKLFIGVDMRSTGNAERDITVGTIATVSVQDNQVNVTKILNTAEFSFTDDINDTNSDINLSSINKGTRINSKISITGTNIVNGSDHADTITALSNWTYERLPNVFDGIDRLSMKIVEDDLVIEVKDSYDKYQYQYWIKSKVDTENRDGIIKQTIWQMVKVFSDSVTAKEPLNDKYLIDEKYNIIVRIKSGSKIVKELFGSYSPQDLGQAKINSVIVNGKSGEPLYVISDNQTLNIKINSNGAENISYKLYNGSVIIPQSAESGVFQLNISEYEQGIHNFTAVVQNQAGIDESSFKIYISKEFNAGKIAVIENLVGSETNGVTTFKMQLKYANGSNIDQQDADDYNIILRSEAENLTLLKAENNAQGILEAVFTKDYNNQHGIYRLYGAVSRDTVTGEDDAIIVYYDGNARDASLSLTGEATVLAGETLTITANGSIDDYEGTLNYAFYREDASGWVLVRDYSTNNKLNWTPLRPGQYVIQARIKANDGGSYEKASSKIYTVTSVALEGNPMLNVYDYQTGEVATTFNALSPYRITANYEGNENVLYMFTVYTQNKSLVYLNTYSPNKSILFVPNKNDTFTITVRVISEDSYGFRDVSQSIVINAGF